MNNEELFLKIHEAWNNLSYEYAMKSEDGKFSMTDMCAAFHKGAESVIACFGIDLND